MEKERKASWEIAPPILERERIARLHNLSQVSSSILDLTKV
jgi:hypothetical protein